MLEIVPIFVDFYIESCLLIDTSNEFVADHYWRSTRERTQNSHGVFEFLALILMT